jgi:hypothetical protein
MTFAELVLAIEELDGRRVSLVLHAGQAWDPFLTVEGQIERDPLSDDGGAVFFGLALGPDPALGRGGLTLNPLRSSLPNGKRRWLPAERP